MHKLQEVRLSPFYAMAIVPCVGWWRKWPSETDLRGNKMEPRAKREAKPGIESSQKKRREIALRRQKERRSDILVRVRQLLNDEHANSRADETEKEMIPESHVVDKLGRNSKADRTKILRERRRYWATQLTAPEWMVSLSYCLSACFNIQYPLSCFFDFFYISSI